MGLDVVEVERMVRLLADNPAAAERLFTERELGYCRARRHGGGAHFAARFAAKEAVLKAFGTGLGPRMRWTDVEVVHAAGGRPVIELHGAVAGLARQRGLHDLDVSLTHSGGLALAHAVAVWRRPEPAACAST